MSTLTFYGKNNPLVETFDFVPEKVLHEAADPHLVLTEDARPSKRMVIEGVFQRADTPNLNKRVYPRGLWERLCDPKSSMQKRISERAMVGHVEHPKDGTTDLSQSAILVTEVKLLEDGRVWGRALVYNTPAGRIVQELIDTGTKFGISSRGTGSVDSKGVVQEDYNCDTWDIVFNPSTPGAHPKLTTESQETVVTEANKNTPDAVVVSEAAASIEQILLQKGGAEWVKTKTGLEGSNLALVFGRFLTFVQQRGAAFHDLDPLWPEFEKFYPQMKDLAKSAGEGGAPASEPAKVTPPPSNDLPPVKKIGEDAPAVIEPADKAKVEEPKKTQLDEEGVALLAEAKATVTRLEGEVVVLSEKVKTVSTELESSIAKAASLTEANTRLQAETDKSNAMVAKLESTLGALTAVNVAAQVREAVEASVQADPRLAAFRDVLESMQTPAAVEARAKKLVDTLQESAPKETTPPKAKSLEERVRPRTKLIAEKSLPSGSVTSDDDAETVSESVTAKAPAHKGAAAVARVLRKGLHG